MGSSKIISWLILIGLISNYVLAQSIISIDINKPIFNVNDEINVTAIISNPSQDKVYLQYLVLDSDGKGPSISDTIKINPASVEPIVIYKSRVNMDFRNGDYSVLVRLVDRLQNNIFDSKLLNFTVVGLPEEFDINVFTCKERVCTEKPKIFLMDEEIYLDYSSDIPNPSITTTLTYPDQTTQQLTLPTSIKTDQIGTYTLELTASKQGYKTITKTEQFAVIEKNAEIKFVGKCNADGICNDEETAQNCPQDCVEGEIKGLPMWVMITAILAIIFLVIIGFEVWRKNRKM